MKITKIVCTPFALKLKRPLHAVVSTMTASEHVLVEVHTDAGFIGVADAPVRAWAGFYGESLASIVYAIERWFAPALEGLDPFEIERAWLAFDRVANNNAAKAAVDIALHDIMGQALGVSCRRLLGGWTDSLRVLHICGTDEPAEVVQEIRGLMEQYGITAFKMKVGLDVRQDERRLVHVRRELPGVELNIDGNQALNQQDAMRLMKVAAECGVGWAEEPCSVHDRAGRGRLAETSPVPVLGDESCRTVEEVWRELADGAVNMVSIKTARTGFYKSKYVLGLAAAAHARCLVASHADSGIGLVATWHFAAAHQATAQHATDLTFFLHYQGDVLESPLPIKDGRMGLPEAPGLGIRLDRAKIEHYAVR